ncbi:MAG: M23 family metallopeptidase [Verrucomicrobiota bacterium]|nr:M23 family metallopeptidase [Verrucomicrobiota bacterium]
MRRQFVLLLATIGGAATALAGSDSAFTRVADGFDFPVGKPNAEGFYKARGFRQNGHLGEDWNGLGGGDSDLGSPIAAIGNGVVVFARDVHSGWGNVVIVRHSYYEGGHLNYVDSLYGHLNQIFVREGQSVSRGDRIATMGSNHGMYPAHLHLEIRKNLSIGMARASFARDFSNYYDPTRFIETHRALRGGPSNTVIAMNTFAQPRDYPMPVVDSARGSGGGVARTGAARHSFKIDRYSDITLH